ncbi:MAG: phage tail protein, partial [Pseudomonadota bacterium]|nr:phage tail protein [Pseudomonadota bacterium]
MANFPGLKLTDAGKMLQAKAQTGQPLSFTRVGLGDGAIPESPADLTKLVNEKHSLSIQRQEIPGDGTVTLRVIMTNQGLSTGFFMRELGIFATDPDTGDELLYSYSNAGEETDFLPAAGGAVVWEGVFDIITIIGNANNVTAVIDDYITIALKSEVDALAPYVLPKAGTVGQMVRKASNAEGDYELFDAELDGFDVRLTSIEEPRTAVANQRTFTLQKTLTNGLAVYINGERISRERWAAISATQLQLNDALAAGTRVLFVNNEEAGPGRALNVSLNGPTLVYPGQSNTYTLSDYDAFAVYTLTTTVGTVSRNGATITLTVPREATDETLDLSVTRDNVRAAFRIAVGDAAIATPEITYPANAATGVDFEPDLSATSFLAYPEEYDSHVSSQWQVATDSGFTNIVFDSGDDTDNLNAINLGAHGVRLDSATRYYVRARFKGETLTSQWSDASYFNTALIYVRQPRIITPPDGETGIVEQPTFQSDAFSVYGATDTHAATDWRLMDASGNTVWESLNDSENLTSITPPKGVLQEGQTEYQVMVRYHGAEYGSSVWSPANNFVTVDVFQYIVQPTVTAPADGATGVPEMPVIESSAFTTFPAGVDAQTAADWRVMDAQGAIVWESLNDAENLTSIVIPAGVLSESTTYTIQFRHHGSSLPESEWGSASITTTATFVP